NWRGVEQREVHAASKEEGGGARRHKGKDQGAQGGGHWGAGPAADPDLVRADLRRLLQQGEGTEPFDLLWHLRRVSLGQRLAGELTEGTTAHRASMRR